MTGEQGVLRGLKIPPYPAGVFPVVGIADQRVNAGLLGLPPFLLRPKPSLFFGPDPGRFRRDPIRLPLLVLHAGVLGDPPPPPFPLGIVESAESILYHYWNNVPDLMFHQMGDTRIPRAVDAAT